MKKMSLVKNIINRIAEIGLSNIAADDDKRHIRLTNYYTIMSIISIVIYNILFLTIDFKQMLEPVLVTSLFIPALLLVFYLNKIGKIILSRYIFSFSITGVMFTATNFYFGNTAGMHILFLLYAIAVSMIWNRKYIYFISAYFLLNISLFLYIEFLKSFDTIPIPLPVNYFLVFRFISYFLTFFSIWLVVIIFRIQVKNNSEKLKEQAYGLLSKNIVLARQKEEINTQRELLKNKNEELNTKNIEIMNQNITLSELNATKDKFFSIIAHDLRNPISTLKAVTEQLSNDFEEFSDQEKLDFFRHMEKASAQVYYLMENLLTWSQSQRGKLEFEPCKMDLYYSVKEILDLSRLKADEKSIRLVNNICENTLVYADANMLNTILRNLVSNALKFTKEQGIISVSADEFDDYYEISVKDTGVGMKPEVVELLFRIDVNISNYGTYNERGSGLGLILCKEFVEKHGGRIWAESELGKGSIFTFTMKKFKE